MKEKFLAEYDSEKAVKTYSKGTAGDGIEYLLSNVYGPIYMDVTENYLLKQKGNEGLRLLEFGCGVGMNLIYLMNLLQGNNINVHSAYGTDFSPSLIDAAKKEARKYLQGFDKVKFYTASNENLINELTIESGMEKSSLINSFDLVFGINTFRYCHRLKKHEECAKNIHRLLVAGGICIIIDMNSKFPLFRSTIKDRLTKSKEEYFLPTLNDYVRTFESSGFEILAQKNFCWVPHSSKGIELKLCIKLTPILNWLFPNNAMRSMVISRKPI